MLHKQRLTLEQLLPGYGVFIVSVFAQVQAHVAQTEVDPGAAVAWLQVTDAGMEASPTGSQLIR